MPRNSVHPNSKSNLKSDEGMSGHREPLYHLPIFAMLYRRLFPRPALAIPLMVCIVAGYRTILLVSEKQNNSHECLVGIKDRFKQTLGHNTRQLLVLRNT